MRDTVVVCILASTAWLALSMHPTPVAAQVGYGIDVASKSRYVWRGLTYRNAAVLQPEVFFTYGKPTSLVTLGAWTNVEPSGVSSQGIGYNQQFFGETNVWVEYARRWKPLEVAAGWTGYFFDTDEAVGLPRGLTNTHEVYGRLWAHPLSRLALGLAGWYDVDAVKGAYLEGTVRLRVPVWMNFSAPLGSLYLQGQAGYSLGQEVNDNDPSEVAYFRDSGLTHYDVSASTTIGNIGVGLFNLAVNLEVHVPINQDPRTNNTKVWGGVTVSLIGPRCRPKRDICP